MVFVSIGLCVVATLVHWLLAKRAVSALQLAARYACLFLIGLSGLFACAGHVFKADDVARMIGWPAGNPFQFEVAMADLAFGALGVLAYRFAGGFRVAAALGWAIFFIGDGVGHLRQLAVAGDRAPLNAGAGILLADLAVPVVVLALVLVAAKRAAAPRS